MYSYETHDEGSDFAADFQGFMDSGVETIWIGISPTYTKIHSQIAQSWRKEILLYSSDLSDNIMKLQRIQIQSEPISLFYYSNLPMYTSINIHTQHPLMTKPRSSPGKPLRRPQQHELATRLLNLAGTRYSLQPQRHTQNLRTQRGTHRGRATRNTHASTDLPQNFRVRRRLRKRRRRRLLLRHSFQRICWACRDFLAEHHPWAILPGFWGIRLRLQSTLPVQENHSWKHQGSHQPGALHCQYPAWTL